MLSKILNKYIKLKETNSNSNIKTYSARIEPIIKEITLKDINEYYLIKEKIENNRNLIYEIIEENKKIYIILENNPDKISIIDKLILEKENIPSEKEDSVFGLIPTTELAKPLKPGEITNFPMTTQGFIDPIIEQELSNPQETIFQESTLNNPPETTFTSQDTRIKYAPNQVLNSFISQDNQNSSFNHTPEVQTIPGFEQQNPVMPTPSVEINYINPTPTIEKISNNPDSSAEHMPPIQQISNFNKNPVYPISGGEVMSTIPPTTNVEQESFIFNTSVQSINSTPVVTAPAPLSPSSNVENTESILLPNNATEINSTNPMTGIDGSSSNQKFSHRRTRSAIKDEDFHRKRPIYDNVNKFYKFNDDRYRGFRLGLKFF